MNELVSAISLAALALFLFVPYNAYRVDRLRQKIFALRDELFDDARDGRIRFDSEAYGATRSLLNGVIRYSHRISFAKMLTLQLLMRGQASPPSLDGLAQAMRSAPGEDRELCHAYINRANYLIVEHVLMSPSVLMFVLPQLLWVVFRKAGVDVAGRAVELCRQQFAEFDRIAFQEGKI